MHCPSYSRIPMAVVALAILVNLTNVGCAQRTGVQAGAVTPPVVDLSPSTADAAAVPVDDDGPALNAADLSPQKASAAPAADIADLENAAERDDDNEVVQLPRQSPDALQPIADAERASPPPAPEVPADAESADDAVARQPDAFHPPLKTVEQRLDELEQRLEFHRQAILELGDVSTIDERLQKMERDLADLRSSFNNVAKNIADEKPRLSQEQMPDVGISEEQTSQKQTSQPLGLLVIENQTGLVYPMTVNGYRFQIVPGRHQFKVPVGDVVTQLNGFEDAKTWRADDWRNVNGQQQLAIQIQ